YRSPGPCLPERSGGHRARASAAGRGASRGAAGTSAGDLRTEKEAVMRVLIRMLAVLALGALAAQVQGAAPWAQSLAAQALASGFLSRLPPNLSKNFALTNPDEGTEVRQLITRSSRQSRTFNVSVAN